VRTDALIELLARSAVPVPAGAAARKFRRLLLSGVALTVAVSLLVLGVRADWRDAIQLPMFWIKLAFPLATAALASFALWRLAHPGMRAGALWWAVPLPMVLVWLLAIRELASGAGPERAELVLRPGWWGCVTAIVLLSAPAFVLAVRAARSLAPTRLRLSGAVGGLVAGGLAAAAFSVHCVQMGAAYLGVWYALGMLVPAGIGALVAPRLLRW